MTAQPLDALAIGTVVARGPDWKWDNQDEGGFGTVIEGEKESVAVAGWVWVEWASGRTQNYRWGFRGHYDLRVLSDAEIETMRSRGMAKTAAVLERAKKLLEGRIAMSERTSEVHPDLLARELAKARVSAYRLALLDLDTASMEAAKP